MKQFTTILLSGLFALLFTACGGGSSDSTTPTTVNPNGLWAGTQVINGINSDVQYIVYNNEIQGYSVGANAGFAGVSSISGDQISANYNLYDGDTGYAIGTGTASGTVVEQSSITGSFTNSFGQTGTLSLVFGNEYNNPSSLSYVAYDYTVTGGSFTISSTGALTGNVDGCTVNGNVSIPDSSVNIYDISYTLSGASCLVPGDYSGLGTITYSADYAAYVLQAGMSNDDYMTLLLAQVPKPSTF